MKGELVKYILVILLIIPGKAGFTQLGGTSTYQFLNLPNSARVASMGGKINAIYDNDLALAFQNPSLLNPTMDNHLVMNYADYFTDIDYGYFSFAKTLGKERTLAVGIHYIDYGIFEGTDEKGQYTNNFLAAEYAMNIMYSFNIHERVRVGVNLKPLMSFLERYDSYGLASDVGIVYNDRDMLFTGTVVLKNMGSQLKTYTVRNYEPLPFEIQMGISNKLRHAPFRFSIVAQHLQRLDLTYKVPVDESTELSQTETETSKFYQYSDKALRHLIFGAEFFPLKNFYIRAGYNYMRRQELKVPTRVSSVGLSWGIGLRISKLHISYGRATYHLAGATNNFSLSTDLSEIFKRHAKTE